MINIYFSVSLGQIGSSLIRIDGYALNMEDGNAQFRLSEDSSHVLGCVTQSAKLQCMHGFGISRLLRLTTRGGLSEEPGISIKLQCMHGSQYIKSIDTCLKRKTQ